MSAARRGRTLAPILLDPAASRVRLGQRSPLSPRLTVLAVGDPASKRAYSGSLRQLVLALQRAGGLHDAHDVELPPILRSVHRLGAAIRARRWRGTQLLAAWGGRGVAARSERATRHLAEARRTGATGALLYGTNQFPAPWGARSALPIGAAFDVTFAQLARAREGWFARLTPQEVEACIARQRAVLLRCEHLFPRSEWCAQSLLEDYGLPRERMVVTGAGANFDTPPPLRRGYDGRTVLFTGRDWDRKNGPLVLAAFALARQARPDLRCIVVGPTQPASAKRQSGVEWLGPLDGPERRRLVQLYSEASLFVMPSRFEPFGVSVLEAMEAGCPVVTLDRGALREVVRDGVTGSLVAEESPHALADALLGWLSDDVRLAAAGRAAREHVALCYTWDRAAARILTAFAGGVATDDEPLWRWNEPA
jgi:glycosyltransferase involved in cell wall biosynthesis